MNCDTASIDVSSVIWVVTQNKIGLFQVEPTIRYNINNDGSLRISALEIVDEEFYACGYLDAKNYFVSKSTYFVFIKGIFKFFFLIKSKYTFRSFVLVLPSLRLLLGNQLLNGNQEQSKANETFL